MTVLIAGGGISGLALALSCQQQGLPFRIFEASRSLRPLGVGINLQPTAVRELYALGLAEGLAGIGVETAEFTLYSKRGLHVWSESRGRALGYDWPQYSVHRGHLQMLLYETLVARGGGVDTGARVVGFTQHADGVSLRYVQDGVEKAAHGTVLIGADGIHSAIRAQMNPGEGPPLWSGAMLWRGTTEAKPFLTGASMAIIGHEGRRIVTYPISRADPETGLATINWIAMRNRDPGQGFAKEDYSRRAELADFLPAFEDFRFDWIDVPALIRGAAEVFEYPMVDRDSLDTWTDGAVTLMGDAAHAAYPVGSNGAGAGIIDARKLVAAFLAHGIGAEALQTYEAEMRPVTSRMILMNRTAGPDVILDTVEERCGGKFDRIEDVISKAEMDAHAAKYKAAAGLSVDETNAGMILPGGVDPHLT